MWTSSKERKKTDRTRRFVYGERKTQKQIWAILTGINIHFNKASESRFFVLKGQNSPTHWNKESEAFIHKYTSKGKAEGHLCC